MVHKCIEESYVCQNENHDDTFYYFYTMSSPENEFYNVKIEVRNNIYYSLPDLDIGYIKIKNRNNKIVINWDHYGYKLSYSMNISEENRWMLFEINNYKRRQEDYIMERVVQFLKEARQSMLDAYPSLTMEK